MQTLHRSRDRLVGERTALINQLRAILLERGIVIPQGKRHLERHLAALLDSEDARGLSPRMRLLIADGRAQWRELDRRIAVFDAEFAAFTKENEDAKRLATIPGVGVMIASALIAAIGKAEAFEHGRDLSAWLGLVPRQSTTGGKPKLFGISKTGQQISAQVADPRRARGAATHCGTRHGAWPMGQGIARPRASQCRRRGLGQQAGADRVGGIATRRNVRRQGSVRGGIGIGWSAHETLIGRRCLRVVKTRDGLTDSRTASWKPGIKNGARRREFYEDRDARISILAGSSLRGRIRCSRLIKRRSR